MVEVKQLLQHVAGLLATAAVVMLQKKIKHNASNKMVYYELSAEMHYKLQLLRYITTRHATTASTVWTSINKELEFMTWTGFPHSCLQKFPDFSGTPKVFPGLYCTLVAQQR